MRELTRITISSEEVVYYLRKNLQLKEIYEKILSQKIIEQATRERGITVTAEEIQAEAERIRREQRLEKAADTLAWLAEQMITPDDWETGIRDRLLKEKLAKSLFDRDVEKYFAQNLVYFEQIVLYQIIVNSDKLAQEILFQTEEKEISFYEAAYLYNIDEQSRYRCGYEGKLYRWSLKPDVAAVIFSAQPPQIVGPLQIDTKYHLFMVEKLIPAQLNPETYREIRDRLFQEWLVGETNYWLHDRASHALTDVV